MQKQLEEKAKKLCEEYFEGDFALMQNDKKEICLIANPGTKIWKIFETFASWQDAINYFLQRQKKDKLSDTVNENPELLEDEAIALQYFEE